MSWEDAVDEAGKWIGSLHLGRVLDGQTIDLTAAADALPFEGVFRDMVDSWEKLASRCRTSS